ncbi:fimbrial biogenesis outer membrane usher protein, partial [Salmonella enterica subsp. enterica]|nr:fimbrial biogenesis outer membrane usher protein [Salmonella enterica subsp. enterica serovar Java]
LGYLTPYQKNDISIDPTTLPDDAAVSQTSVSVVPTRGAVVKAAFRTSVGKRLLLTLTTGGDGKPVPFGAVATVEGSENSTGITGDGGRVYLTGVQEDSRVTVRWGQGQSQRCTADIHVPEQAGAAGVYVAQAQCR